MSFRILGCVVLCLLGAGPVEAGVTQTPRHFITRTGRQLTLYCSQDMNHDAMYWYRQDPGVGLKLIYFSRNVDFIEDGDVPDGYRVLRKEKKNFPLTLKSAGTNQTSLYLCASRVSTALLSQLLSARKARARARTLLAKQEENSPHHQCPRSPSLIPQLQGL